VKKTLRETEEALRAYLGLNSHLVGVKLEKTELRVADSTPGMPMAFCQIVRATALKGEKIISTLEGEKCPVAQIVLGFKDSRFLQTSYRTIPPGTKRIIVSPLSDFTVLPDVVLAILTPRQIMSMAIILNSVEGKPLSSEFTGEHACSEFIAKPYVDGEPNVSFLCNAARGTFSDYRDNEAILGAPLEVCIRASEIVRRMDEAAGSLCGCRTSDVPLGVIDEFEKIGFSKGTDYFFGRLKGLNIRVYLNKDSKGKIRLMTIHLPVKTSSQTAAEEMAKRLNGLMPRPYFVNVRGPWLDLTVSLSLDALGVDLFDSSSIKAAVEGFVEKMGMYLERARE
jgi:uncharacterized protein (DUF169 family)